MDAVRSLIRKVTRAETLSLTLILVAGLYALLMGDASSIVAGGAFALMVYAALPKQLTLALLVGASVILLLQTKTSYMEGFEDGAGNVVIMTKEKKEKKEGASDEEDKDDPKAPNSAVYVNAEARKDEPSAMKPLEPHEQQKEGFGPERKVMLPDNTDRREPLVLGKPYKLPSETDDKDYHLDAGTTFLNAYKALKPDQIAAMTRDTQELLATQKSLVSMLDSFGPLIKDMNKITGFFGPT